MTDLTVSLVGGVLTLRVVVAPLLAPNAGTVVTAEAARLVDSRVQVQSPVVGGGPVRAGRAGGGGQEDPVMHSEWIVRAGVERGNSLTGDPISDLPPGESLRVHQHGLDVTFKPTARLQQVEIVGAAVRTNSLQVELCLHGHFTERAVGLRAGKVVQSRLADSEPHAVLVAIHVIGLL